MPRFLTTPFTPSLPNRPLLSLVLLIYKPVILCPPPSNVPLNSLFSMPPIGVHDLPVALLYVPDISIFIFSAKYSPLKSLPPFTSSRNCSSIARVKIRYGCVSVPSHLISGTDLNVGLPHKPLISHTVLKSQSINLLLSLKSSAEMALSLSLNISSIKYSPLQPLRK